MSTQIQVHVGQNYAGVRLPDHGAFEATIEAFEATRQRLKADLIAEVCAIYDGTSFSKKTYWRGYSRDILAVIVASSRVSE